MRYRQAGIHKYGNEIVTSSISSHKGTYGRVGLVTKPCDLASSDTLKCNVCYAALLQGVTKIVDL